MPDMPAVQDPAAAVENRIDEKGAAKAAEGPVTKKNMQKPNDSKVFAP